jgi:beta-lactamase class A
MRLNKARLVPLVGICVALASASISAASPVPDAPRWAAPLQTKLERVDRAYPGEIGVYVKDLQTGEDFSFRGDEHWYLASMVKVPVAITIMRAVERGDLALDQKLSLLSGDYVDGAGRTNQYGPGEQLTVDWLIGQMLVNSDNTATDVLIRQVGLKAVNEVVAELVPAGFDTITTLADVRRHVYSHYHPAAINLVGRQFLTLRQQRSEAERRATLARFLEVPQQDLAPVSYDQAFNLYYQEGPNSGELTAYGALLERFFRGDALQPESTQYLLSVMGKVATGKNRLRDGLPKGVALAHKTGTQRGRFCDAGIAQAGEDEDRRSVVIVACTRGSLSTARSEQALSGAAHAIGETGLFTLPLTVSGATP